MDLHEIVNSPYLFANTALKVLNKDSKLVPLDWNSVQHSIFPRLTGRDLILKARQMGVTTQIQGEIFRQCVTKTTRALSLSKDDEGTTYLREMQDRFYKNLPEPKPLRKYANDTVTTYPGFDSSHMIRTAGSSSVGRGSSFNFIHGTEVAFWKDAESILAGALQAGNPYIVLESTANGAQGWFYERCMDALAGRGNWNLIFIPYTEFPDYTGEDWVNTKRQELGRMFSQEYPRDAVEAFLTSNKGYFADIPGDLYTAPNNAVWQAGHRYSAGIDWGQSNDFTCMIVVDRTTRQMVDKLHINKTAWGVQRVMIKQLYNKWRLGSVRAEKNSIGSVNIEELQADGVNVEAFVTSNSTKAKIFSQLHEELETGLALQNWDILRSELNSITSKQTPTGLWTISADGNGHDDTAITLALAISARIEIPQTRVWR